MHELSYAQGSLSQPMEPQTAGPSGKPSRLGASCSVNHKIDWQPAGQLGPPPVTPLVV